MHSEEEMQALKSSWRRGQHWQFRPLHGLHGWRDLPAHYEPGWFFDTEYRRKPGTETEIEAQEQHA